MKLFFLVPVVLFFLFPSMGSAGDTSYHANLKGIECSGCKKTIAKSLGKLNGVKTIRIVKGSGDNHTLTVVTDGTAAISKSDARKALGKNAPHYEIVSWSQTN